MQEEPSNILFDLPEDKGPSPLPWVVAGLALGLSLLSFSADARRIPARLQASGAELLANTRLPGLSLAVDGRDLALSGVVGPEVDRPTLLARLGAIDGVRSVEDRLEVTDPVAQAAARAESFRSALARIDTGTISFELGSTSLAEGSGAPLNELAQLLRSYPEQRVRISGHTDNLGRVDVNVRISRERAQSVAGYLQRAGVRNEQLLVRGYGSAQPIADNGTEAGRARNRRIEINSID